MASFYVGNVNINTKLEDVKAMIEEQGVAAVNLEELQRRDNRYKSFKLVIRKKHIYAIKDPNFFPKGISVRKWYSPRKFIRKWTAEGNAMPNHPNEC